MDLPTRTNQQSPARNVRPAEAAEFLGVSLAQFWRYAKTDPAFPKPIKLSSRVTVVPLDDLAAWIDSRRVSEVA